MSRYDVYARFADIHLRTAAERAVYFTLVAQLAESWSIAEIAALKGLDERELKAILERYEAAGIVRGTPSPSEQRFHWRSDMNYLFGNPDSAGPADPICGMPVTDDSPYRVTDGFRRQILFCSAMCLAAFRELGGTPPAATF